jgi:hypothetical protein
MKTIDEIEKLDLEDLERISLDESIEVPADLESRIHERTSGAANESWFVRMTNRRPVWYVGIAASFAVIAGIGFTWINRSKPLKDTFDDPMLAYAAVEEALNKMASTVEVGVSSVAMSDKLFRTPTEVIESINNK